MKTKKYIDFDIDIEILLKVQNLIFYGTYPKCAYVKIYQLIIQTENNVECSIFK